MEIRKINEHFTAEIMMTEAEMQSIIELFESHAMLRNCPPDDLYLGLRGELYRKLKEALTPHSH